MSSLGHQINGNKLNHLPHPLVPIYISGGGYKLNSVWRTIVLAEFS